MINAHVVSLVLNMSVTRGQVAFEAIRQRRWGEGAFLLLLFSDTETAKAYVEMSLCLLCTYVTVTIAYICDFNTDFSCQMCRVWKTRIASYVSRCAGVC